MRVLALDFGSARCGCALSDPTGTLATPIPAVTQPTSEAGLERIRSLVRDRGVERVVVGLPLTLSAGASEQTDAARAFAELLRERLSPVPIELYDERLTTRLAQRTPGSADEDSRAAAHLLEGWLTRRTRTSS
jgi:putative Holliday junction resolvase